VVKDRVCAEWLQCGGGVQLPDGSFSCLDLVRCKGADPKNPSNCTQLVALTSEPEVQTFDFATSVDQTRYLSGYSHVGLNWGNDQSIEGYYSPENMEQVGQKIAVTNNSFEGFGPVELVNEPEIDGWTPNWASNTSNRAAQYNYECSYSLDTRHVFAGQYSLNLTLRNKTTDPQADTICPFSSRGGDDGLRIFES